MQGDALETLISEQRLSTYVRLFNGDRMKALEYYQLNIKIAESFYPLLLYAEVSLRNLVHRSCTIHFKTDQWFRFCQQEEQVAEWELVKKRINDNFQEASTDKIIAELTFGFWCSLLNKRNAKYFWKPLQHAFPNLHKSVKREELASAINQVRKFRNRIFHYEPICNDLKILWQNYLHIIHLFNWMNPELTNWMKSMNVFESLYKKAQAMREDYFEAGAFCQK